MKVIKESFDIYTHKVTVEMTEAEWMAIKGFAAYAARMTLDPPHRRRLPTSW